MTPLLSVVIPVRGDAADFRQLGNVLSQTSDHSGIEIVVVIDGEEQGGLKRWLSSLESDAPVLVRRISERDPGVARNEGLSAARGNYVCFLDSDDEACVADYVHLSRMLSMGRAEVGVLGFETRDDRGASVRVSRWSPVQGAHCAWTDIELRAAVWRFVFDRASLQRTEARFPAGGYGEDLLFLAGVLSHFSNAVGLPKVGYTYRLHSDEQLTNRRPSPLAITGALDQLVELHGASRSTSAKRVLAAWYARISILHYSELKGNTTLNYPRIAAGLAWTGAHRLTGRLSRAGGWIRGRRNSGQDGVP